MNKSPGIDPQAAIERVIADAEAELNRCEQHRAPYAGVALDDLRILLSLARSAVEQTGDHIAGAGKLIEQTEEVREMLRQSKKVLRDAASAFAELGECSEERIVRETADEIATLLERDEERP